MTKARLRPKRYAIWGRLVAMQFDQIAFALIDAASINLFMPSVYPPEQSETIEGLAKKLSLDPERVRETVDTFNAACRPGRFDPTVHDNCRTEGITPPNRTGHAPSRLRRSTAIPCDRGSRLPILALRSILTLA